MRSVSLLILLLTPFILASPIPAPNVEFDVAVRSTNVVRDVLFSFSGDGDPLSIHKREPIPESEPEPLSDTDDMACSDVCGAHRVEGARNEREALCSIAGLQATCELTRPLYQSTYLLCADHADRCAQCIDRTWPETSWDDSAMAEYERIADACRDEPQQCVFCPIV
jgi:hypothetical protein